MKKNYLRTLYKQRRNQNFWGPEKLRFRCHVHINVFSLFRFRSCIRVLYSAAYSTHEKARNMWITCCGLIFFFLGVKKIAEYYYYFIFLLGDVFRWKHSQNLKMSTNSLFVYAHGLRPRTTHINDSTQTFKISKLVNKSFIHTYISNEHHHGRDLGQISESVTFIITTYKDTNLQWLEIRGGNYKLRGANTKFSYTYHP